MAPSQQMAWRIAKHVISGEIDNRTKGRVTGYLELADGSGRITLDLEGNTHPDLAGSHIRFTNPRALTEPLENFPRQQAGQAGDITASHRVKDLLVPVETFLQMDKDARSKAYRWANCLYLEWFGNLNGRVVVEGVGFQVEWIEGPLWHITEEDLREQAARAAEGMVGFFEKVSDVLQIEAALAAEDGVEGVSPSEARMDAEAARMDLLNDRIGRRMEKEAPENWERIYEEESARLRSERGEPDPPPPTPEEEAARSAWIEELNAANEFSDWSGKKSPDHPLVSAAREFALELRHDASFPKGVSDEHPLREIANGVFFASGKLAGALNACARDEEWPPNEWAAPSVLLFLKKARGYLRDALRGLDSADEEHLGDARWRTATRTRINLLLATTQQHIVEARQALSDDPDA